MGHDGPVAGAAQVRFQQPSSARIIFHDQYVAVTTVGGFRRNGLRGATRGEWTPTAGEGGSATPTGGAPHQQVASSMASATSVSRA